MATDIVLEDTEKSFRYKTDADLKKAKWLFSLMSYDWLVKIGTRLVPYALKWKLPVRSLIKNTIFNQFVGGETLADLKDVLAELQKYEVKAILDFGAEGKDEEASFEYTRDEFLRLIDYAASDDNVPFISIKLTGLAPFALLEIVNTGISFDSGEFSIDLNHLTALEAENWEKVVERVDSVCRKGLEKGVAVLIDAEESWIQDTIDALACEMMKKYNAEQAIVFNTIQFYRRNRLEFLVKSSVNAMKEGYLLGVKMVRGAYMEKERERALKLNYISPIQPDKQSTDSDFNAALEFCVRNLSSISLVVASHNETSNLFATELLRKFNYQEGHPHIHFSQLYGMSDHITFNLASAGYSVSKYLPYGSIDDVIPYLMRRAAENTSVGTQTSRELFLIKKEIARRKNV